LYLPSLINNTNEKKNEHVFSLSPEQTDDQSNEKQQDNSQQLESVKLEKALTENLANYIQPMLSYFDYHAALNADYYDQTKAVFDDTTYQDLTVFCGQKGSPAESFFNIVDRTQTISGRIALLNILYNPLTDISELAKRQTGIKKLVEDKQLYSLLQEKLETIKNTEHTFFLMLNEIHFELISKIADQFYLKSIFDIPGVSMISNIPVLGMICLLDHLPFMKTINSWVCNKLNKKQSLLEVARLQRHFNSLVVMPTTFLGIAGYLGFKAYKTGQDNHYLNATQYAGGSLGMAIFAWILAKEVYKTTADDIKVENILHKALGGLAKMTLAIKDMQQTIDQHTELSTLIPLKNFEQTENDELRNILELFNAENFNEEAKWTTPKGKMMASLKLLQNLKKTILKGLTEIGKLDALMSIATLYKTHAQNPNARYYFANYEQQKTPHLLLNNFWNPFISPNTVVTNSLELGTQNAYRNMLITGPNAGGKSTALKAISFAVLLAQTFTIANANIALTPFTKVFTTLNITDALGKASLYEADKNRIKEVTTSFANLDENQKGLLISDEMFNSTDASYGAALFYGTLKYVDNQLKNTIFAAATHFSKLTDLEEETYGSIANFCLEEALLDEHGKLFWTYKLKPGINKQNISFELAQEDGFAPEILTSATEFLKKICSQTKNQSLKSLQNL